MVMVVGGSHQRADDVEIIDLSPRGGVCSKPADLPDGTDFGLGAVGSFIDGKPIICGGMKGTSFCHEYYFETQRWETSSFLMLRSRTEAAGITMANGSWLIIGGRTPEVGQDEEIGLADSEILMNR